MDCFFLEAGAAESSSSSSYSFLFFLNFSLCWYLAPEPLACPPDLCLGGCPDLAATAFGGLAFLSTLLGGMMVFFKRSSDFVTSDKTDLILSSPENERERKRKDKNISLNYLQANPDPSPSLSGPWAGAA